MPLIRGTVPTMTTFETFRERCQLRLDSGDQFQVRYHHPDGQSFDTWVSGEEVLSRLRSSEAEERLRGVSRLDLDALRQAAEGLPDRMREQARQSLRDRLGDEVEETLGDGPVSAGLADAIRGRLRPADPEAEARATWLELAKQPAFRDGILALAWIQLAGSLPAEPPGEPTDWL
jgi:hypothetical protein